MGKVGSTGPRRSENEEHLRTVKLFPTKRGRILIDGSPLTAGHFSGIGHYAKGLLQGLDAVLAAEDDLDVRLVVAADQIPHVGTFGFRRIRPLALPLSNGALRERVRTGRLPPMDLLLGPGTYFFPNYVRWPLAYSPSITAVHDLSFEKVPDLVDAPNGEYLRSVVRDSVARSDVVTALTHTMADEIAEHYAVARDRVHVVGCAADTTHFYRRSEREIRDVTARYGVFGDYLVSVGNIEPRKNQVRLIDAFCALPREVTDDSMLVLIGAGAWREEAIRSRIHAAVADNYKIKLLLDAVTDADLPALYSGATGSAYVSVYEGFGMPPLESMACRTPAISSRCSVMPEVAGDAAVLVDPHDGGSMTAALADLLTATTDRRADLVERGLANVARYDWEDSARSLLASVRSLEGVAR